MGRYQKPYYAQRSHLTKAEKETRAQAEEMVTVGREDLEKPPSWLVDTVAKKEFKRIIKELNEIEIVGNLDLGNLGGYCNAFSYYRKATDELKRASLTITVTDKDGNETVKEHPLINIQKKYAEEMRKFASLVGLTIDSRLKAAVVKKGQYDDTIHSEFGDI